MISVVALHASSTTPVARESHAPCGATFSRSTKIARPAIQSTFMTPPTSSKAMSSQQQPRQQRS